METGLHASDFQRLIKMLKDHKDQQVPMRAKCKNGYCASGLLPLLFDPEYYDKYEDEVLWVDDKDLQQHGINIKFSAMLMRMNDTDNLSFVQIADTLQTMHIYGALSANGPMKETENVN